MTIERPGESEDDGVLVLVTRCGRGEPNRERSELERRQGLAGEEDQSVPGWDFGA